MIDDRLEVRKSSRACVLYSSSEHTK